MKKKPLFFALAVCAVLYAAGGTAETDTVSGAGTSSQTSSDTPSQIESSESSWTVSDDDIFPILFHQPYLDAADIKVYCQSERKKMPDRIISALQRTPCVLEYRNGGLFGADYYAVTSRQMGYSYYGKTKDNRPDGFGVLSEGKVDLSDWDSISNLVYAGNFKDGVYDGYGVEFNKDSDTDNVVTFVSDYLRDGGFDEKYWSLAMLYLESHVTYDGTWKNGQADGEGNAFIVNDLDYLQMNASNVPKDYWGNILYPAIVVAEAKKGMENGDTKMYISGTLIFDGTMKDGVQNGDGIQYFLNGKKMYDGQWKNGRYHGKGKLYDKEGNLIYSGKWENGDYAS